jgi:hypothetical protein
MKGKYIDATQDQVDILNHIDEVTEKGMYVMNLNQFSTGKPNPYRQAKKSDE